MAFACMIGAHRWAACKCQVCGKTRDEGHTWTGCTCSTCAKHRDEGHQFADDALSTACSICSRKQGAFRAPILEADLRAIEELASSDKLPPARVPILMKYGSPELVRQCEALLAALADAMALNAPTRGQSRGQLAARLDALPGVYERLKAADRVVKTTFTNEKAAILEQMREAISAARAA